MKLKEITSGLSLAGVEPTQIVSVVATVPLGDGALQVIYRTPDGGMKERLLGSADEASISVATIERPFSFDGDGAAFQLTCEPVRKGEPLPTVRRAHGTKNPHLASSPSWCSVVQPCRSAPRNRGKREEKRA